MSKKIKFITDFNYYDRETRQQFVARKYAPILKGKILDVGADEGHMEKYIDQNNNYTGIGLGGSNPDIIRVDLENEEIPFERSTFDCVMCLDVLEHVENIHSLFDKLCDLSKKWVLISLPNPYNDILHYFIGGNYMGREKNMKFYGLPKEREPDRHKWFFSSKEACEFVEYRSKKNGFKIYDYYTEEDNSLMKILKEESLFSGFKSAEVTTGTMWWVLKRR